MTRIDRRGVLAGGAAFAGLLAAPHIARAQSGGPLNLFAHRVMQTVATGSQGGDITKGWSAANVPVQWTTFDTGPLQERLFREASLGETSVDVGFLLNTQAVPRVAELFEPLDDYMKKDPIEAPDDVFDGLLKGMRVGGRQVAIPFRHASSGLHYNETLLAEKGFSAPPKTIEEMVDMALKTTGPRGSGGQPVTGLVMPGVTYPNVIDIARAWDGDFITPDYQYVGDQEPMLKAVRLLRDLFEKRAFPRNFATLSTEDVNVWMQQGRAALSMQSMGRNRIYNDPGKSQFSGKIHTIAVPISASLASKYPVAPAKVEFWGLVIPKNAKRKDLSWSFIKAMLTKDATKGAALNGNGPVRASTYDDTEFKKLVPYADEERRVLTVARIPLPAFDEAARAGDFFKEEVEAAVLGMKTPEQAMTSLGERVRPLLPKA